MPIARKYVYRPGDAGVFHCINRCVRRAFLCGWDDYAGKSFEHRREWVRGRVKELCGIFALDVCAYAVMSNHVHLVVRTRPEVVAGWSDEEVARRWLRFCPGRRDQVAASVDEARLAALLADVERLKTCRERLGNLSWFMRGLSEQIARRANQEDSCAGRFWEGRFKCQRLADAGAVAACMAYVDLNPVRAGLEETPEASEYCGVGDRLRARRGRAELAAWKASGGDESSATEVQKRMLDAARGDVERARWLAPVDAEEGGVLGMSEERYLQLVDWTGRHLRDDKAGAIPADLAPVLERLELDVENWISTVERYGSLYHRVAGNVEKLREAAQRVGQRWFRRRDREGCAGVYRVA
ncbi:MAG: hypothetical protein JJT96_20555 [Opitutales bacterium]|nr:hypothetical protein [Opitutales bacterium]